MAGRIWLAARNCMWRSDVQVCSLDRRDSPDLCITLCAHQQHPARQLLLKIPYCGVAPAEVLWHMLRGVSVPLAPKLAKILQKLSLRSPTTYLLIRALWLMSSL